MSATTRPPAVGEEWDRKFDTDLGSDIACESRLMVKEVVIVALLVVLVVLREWLL
jgi:hypothetical protein